MANYEMRFKNLWEDDHKLEDYLALSLMRGRISLILGAGISKPFGLPDWEDLISDLKIEAGYTAGPGLSLEEQAEIIKNTYCDGEDNKFIEIVAKCLYRNVGDIIDYSMLRNNLPLAAIGSLVMASIRGSVSEIVTLNFDNFLEIYLKMHGFDILSVKEAEHWSALQDVKIYHPHGYIPLKDEGKTSKKIVFDQESYSRVIGNSSNLWHQQVYSVLRTHVCIFIGLSGKDANLDQLMVDTRDNHVATQAGMPYWGIRFSQDEERKEIWERRGIYTKRCDNYHTHMPEMLFRICEKAATKRRATLGL